MTALASHPFSTAEPGLRRLESFVSSHVGVVSDVFELLRRPGDLGLRRFGAEPTVSSSLLGPPLDHLRVSSGGVDLSRESARAAAIGELLERYAASWTPPGSVVATAAELGPEAVDPERFALFAPEQHRRPDFPFAPFTRTTRLRWLRGFTLPDGEPAWLPAQLVLLAQRLAPDEQSIDDQHSSGLACGQTLEEAVLTGLYEVVERDAFMLTWMHRLSLPLVRWQDAAECRRIARRAFDGARLRYEVVDLSAFWRVPTMLALVLGEPGDGVALAVGAAAAATASEAWLKALGEAFCVRVWVSYLRQHAPWEPYTDLETVRDFADHVRFHADATVALRDAFLWASRARRDLDQLPAVAGDTPLAQIEELCARLAGRGYRAYAVDVTSPDVAAGGLRVARAVVPGLVALDVDHRRRHLGGRRILDGPRELGLPSRVRRVDGLNPDPHPFP